MYNASPDAGRHLDAARHVGLRVRQVPQRVVECHVVRDERHVIATDSEAERDEQATCSHERDHVRDAGHDRLLDALAPADLHAALSSLRATFTARDHAASVRVLGCRDGFVEHLAGFRHRTLDAGFDQRHAGEPVASGDADIGSDDDGAGFGDVIRGEGDDPTRALSLDVQLDALLLGCLLQRLRRHIGVGDAGRAGGDRQDHRLGGFPGRGGRSTGGRDRRRGRGWLGLIGLDDRRDQGGGFGRRLGRTQRGQEILADQRPGELGQQLHVGIAGALRRGDADDQVGRAVLRTEVDRFGQPDQSQRGLLDGRRAAVRDRNAAGHARGELRFALFERVQQAGAISASAGSDQRRHLGDDCMFVASDSNPESDQLGSDKRFGHRVSSLIAGSRRRDCATKQATFSRAGRPCCRGRPTGNLRAAIMPAQPQFHCLRIVGCRSQTGRSR